MTRQDSTRERPVLKQTFTVPVYITVEVDGPQSGLRQEAKRLAQRTARELFYHVSGGNVRGFGYVIRKTGNGRAALKEQTERVRLDVGRLTRSLDVVAGKGTGRRNEEFAERLAMEYERQAADDYERADYELWPGEGD